MRKIMVLGLTLLLSACAQQRHQNQSQAEAPSGGQGTIVVQALEYEFQGMPSTVPSGEVVIRLENEGEQPHQMSIARITSDATIEELLRMPEEQSNQQIEDVGNSSSGRASLSAGPSTSPPAGTGSCASCLPSRAAVRTPSRGCSASSARCEDGISRCLRGGT